VSEKAKTKPKSKTESALSKELKELTLAAEIAEARSRVAVANATASENQLKNLKMRAEITKFRTAAK